MKVSFAVAVAENGVIGLANGEIPWRIKTDVKHYKELTLGHPIIMGRKTFVSIGRPLPGRLNIVMTRDDSFVIDGGVVVHDADSALAVAEESGADEAFVIGGGEIYASFLPHASTIYLTRVHASPAGDAHFTFDEDEWKVIDTDERPANPDTDDQYAFTFMTLKRRP